MKIKFDNKGFDFIKKGLKTNYKTRVGIIGSKATTVHANGDLTNALIGSVHEFGSISAGIPRRSFIKYPLEEKIFSWVTANKDNYKKMLEEGNTKRWFTALGLEAERIIDEAFKTRGFGTWQPNDEKTIKKKGSDMPLIDTGELRRSISSQVINDRKR